MREEDTYPLRRDSMTLVMAVVQSLHSSSETAWYIRRMCGVMTSNVKRRSCIVDLRTVARRRLIGWLWTSSPSLQPVYSISCPPDRTTQNLPALFLSEL